MEGDHCVEILKYIEICNRIRLCATCLEFNSTVTKAPGFEEEVAQEQARRSLAIGFSGLKKYREWIKSIVAQGRMRQLRSMFNTMQRRTGSALRFQRVQAVAARAQETKLIRRCFSSLRTLHVHLNKSRRLLEFQMKRRRREVLNAIRLALLMRQCFDSIKGKQEPCLALIDEPSILEYHQVAPTAAATACQMS